MTCQTKSFYKYDEILKIDKELIQLPDKTWVCLKTLSLCPKCGKQFEKIGRTKTCSVTCGQERINWPSYEELSKMLLVYSLVKIGKMLGVSDNAVKKHCKKLGLL